jgi:hypothetical protein
LQEINWCPSTGSGKKPLSGGLLVGVGPFLYVLGEDDGKGGSFIPLTRDLNVPSMFFDEAIADRQAKPDTLHSLLGSEKGVKYLVQVIFPDAPARVDQFNIYMVPVGFCLDGQDAALRHGITGIGNQIQKNLTELILGGIDHGQILFQADGDLDAVFIQLLPHQKKNLVQNNVDIYRLLLFLIRFRKAKHLSK